MQRDVSIPATEIHQEFTDFLQRIAPRPILLTEIGQRIIQQFADEKAKASAHQKGRRERARQIDTQNAELIAMRAQRLITDEEFFAQKQRLRSQLSALQRQIEESEFSPELDTDLADIKTPLADLAKTWESLRATPVLQRFQRLILPGGFVVRKIGTADLGLLFTLIRTLAGQDAGSVHSPCIRLSQVSSDICELREILRAIEVAR